MIAGTTVTSSVVSGGLHSGSGRGGAVQGVCAIGDTDLPLPPKKTGKRRLYGTPVSLHP